MGARSARGSPVRYATVALVAAVLSAGSVVIATTPAGAAITNVVVGPGDIAPGGPWSSPSGGDTGAVGFVVGPATPPLGSGSLSMSVANTSEQRKFYTDEFGGATLASVNALVYSTYRDGSSTTPDVVPTLNIEADPDSTTTSGVNDTTLVWAPAANGLTVNDDVWQSWDAYDGGAGLWYSTADLTGYGVLECPAFTCSATWSQIVSNLPNGIINGGVGPNVGSGWSGFSGNVDGLVVGVGSDATVYNFEQPPRISVGDTSIYEGDSRRRTARVMVSLDQRAPAGGVTMHWATHGGTATSGVDFKGRSGNLYFKAGQTTRYAQILVNADTAAEGDEQFTVSLSSVVGGTVADGTGVVTILDEEGGSLAALSIGSSKVVEGHSGGSRYVFLQVTLRGPSPTTVTVGYSTGGGSASAPADYSGRTGTLTFKPGTRVRWVLVYLSADQTVEGDETFNVTLSSPVGATIAHGTGTVTIVDDD